MIKHYIVLGNGEGWCSKSAAGLSNYDNVRFINGFPAQSYLGKKLSKVCYSNKIPGFFKNILLPILHRDVIKTLNISNNGTTSLVIYDWNRIGNDVKLFKKIRKLFSNVYLIYVFTNITKATGAARSNYLDKLNDWYDVVFAFDREDAKKYNFAYSPLIYDSDPSYDKEKKESKSNLVFYVGQAKDRLPGLLSCFEKLKSLEIKTDFHIANVKEEDTKYADEIIYNKFMTYDECVESIQKSTCLIDVIQGDSTGLTIKTCEAVCYDKKLITTNKHVVEYPFYDPKYIRVVESPEDIDEEFFTENRDVHYSEEGKRYFSADKFLERLENALNK